MIVIPAIDLRGGRVVRLRQGDFAREIAFAHEPAALARSYAEAGAPWLHVVDLDGARAGRLVQTDLLARLAKAGAKLQAGGGVRSREDVERLLALGIARVVVGSAAIRAPQQFESWLDEFGAERVCLALDLRRGDDTRWRPAVDAWQGESDADFASLLDGFVRAGLRHALCTDIAQDGMRGGPNLALYRELSTRWPVMAWIASGGVRDIADVEALRATGVAACVAGSALLDGTLRLDEIAACSRAA